MAELALISTESVSQNELNGVWMSWLSTYVARTPNETDFSGITFMPCESQRFAGCIEYGDIGDSSICRVVSSSYRYARGRPQVSKGTTSAMVVLQTRGKSCFEQEGRKTSLFPGDWNVYDPSRRFSVTSTGQSENLVLVLPESPLTDLNGVLAAMPSRAFGRSGIESTVRDLITASFRDTGKMNYRSGAVLAESLTRLIRTALEEASASHCSAPDLKTQMIDFIAANLTDENLGVTRIAAAFGCSTRQVHRLFQTEAGMTVSEWIWKTRLERSFHDLRNSELRGCTITDIAFNCGFNNAAHFSRLFKGTYGITPRECRLACSR